MAETSYVKMLYPWQAENIQLTANETLRLIEKTTNEWWRVERCSDNTPVYIPANYSEEIKSTQDTELPPKRTAKRPPPPPPLKPRLFNTAERKALDELDAVIVDAQEDDAVLYCNTDELKQLSATARPVTPEQDYGSSDSPPPGSSPPSKCWDGSETSDYRSDSRESLDVVDTPSDNKSYSPRPMEYANLGDIQAHIHRNLSSKSDGDQADDQPDTRPTQQYMNLELIQQAIHRDKASNRSSTGRLSQPKALGPINSFGNLVKLQTPRKEELSPDDVPEGWTEEFGENGEKFYINSFTKDKWLTSLDHEGKRYYYKEGSKETVWQLPKALLRHNSLDCPENPAASRLRSSAGVRASWAGPTAGAAAGWRRIQPPIAPEAIPHIAEDPCGGPERGPGPDRGPVRGASVKPRTITIMPLTKSGLVMKTKTSENGKKIKKNWSSCFLVAHNNFLHMFKDEKSAMPQVKSGSGTFPAVDRAEASIDLSMAKLETASKDDTTKKNCLRLETDTGIYLFNFDKESVMREWFNTIQHNISLWMSKGLSSSDDYLDDDPMTGASGTRAMVMDPAEKIKIKNRLLNWLRRRPAVDELRNRGIFKNAVFGSTLSSIAEREKTVVPSFVLNCIAAIDKRGLSVDGVYRVNGNNAAIQNIRFLVDGNEHYNLMDPKWDVHDVTGALKLFFRELYEPLFPFNLFDKFMSVCKVGDPWTKVRTMKEVIKMMPRVNRETTRALLLHLRRVIQHSNENRMQIQNLAIVFGPSLMWPAQEKASHALTMVSCQSAVLDCLLSDFNKIFDK